jgi:hemerythrin-like domain-containing protein
MPYKNDMTMMLAMHTALRRELVRINRIVEGPGDDPRTMLRAAGWEMFKSYLQVHHAAEDDVLWPAMRLTLAGKDEELALLDAMESEHVRIDPLLEAIDRAVVRTEDEADDVAELVADLSSSLLDHLGHEEQDGLPLIDATVTVQVWQAFAAEHGKRIGSDAGRYFPWVFDGADPSVTASALSRLPPSVQQAFRDEWELAYRRLTLWPKSALNEIANGNL